MPRYFFNVYDGHTEPDADGTELHNDHAARHEAIRLAGRIIDDEAHRIALGEDWHLEVTDRTGLILFQVHLLLTDAPAVPG